MGLAMGLTYAPTFAVIGHHFQGRRRAVAMGLASTGSSIGGIIHPIMLNNLINRGGDAFGTGGTSSTFGRAIRINAGMNAALLVLAAVLMREKKGVVAGGAGRGKVKPNIGGFLTEPKYLLVSLGWVNRNICLLKSLIGGVDAYLGPSDSSSLPSTYNCSPRRKASLQPSHSTPYVAPSIADRTLLNII